MRKIETLKDIKKLSYYPGEEVAWETSQVNFKTTASFRCNLYIGNKDLAAFLTLKDPSTPGEGNLFIPMNMRRPRPETTDPDVYTAMERLTTHNWSQFSHPYMEEVSLAHLGLRPTRYGDFEVGYGGYLIGSGVKYALHILDRKEHLPTEESFTLLESARLLSCRIFEAIPNLTIIPTANTS